MAAWLVPGLGHFLQKRFVRGVIFLTAIALLVLFGVIMQGKLYEYGQFHPLLLLGFLGNLGSGLFYLLVMLLGYGEGSIHVATYHYGTTYLVTAGLLNYLVALNAFDLARGKKK
jgi:hypothetical protein